jgi:hypothetical protein
VSDSLCRFYCRFVASQEFLWHSILGLGGRYIPGGKAARPGGLVVIQIDVESPGGRSVAGEYVARSVTGIPVMCCGLLCVIMSTVKM